jgi:DNA-binding SARP family transcriptional activator
MGFLALVRGKPETGLPLLSNAESLFRSAKDIPNLALCLVRIAWAHRLLGDYPASMMAANEVLKLSSNRSKLGSLRAEAQRSMGLCLFRLGKAKEAVGWFEKSLGFYARMGKKRHASMVETEMGMAYRALGDYPEARNWYEHAIVTFKEIGDLTWQATLLNSMGVLHHAQGEYELAVNAFEEGLECARHSGYLDTEALILTSLGDLYAEIGEVAIAVLTYQQAEGIARMVSDQFLINYLSMVMADLYRQQRAFNKALALLEEVLPAVKASESYYERGLYYLISGKVFLSSGNTQQAIWDLQTAIDQFSQGGLIMEHAWTRLWYAAACHEFGDTVATHGNIKEAVALVGDKLPLHSLVASLVHVQQWLANIVDESQSHPEFARLLDRARHLESGLPGIRKKLRQLSSSVPVQVPHISIHTLGKAQVRINGKLISSTEWQTKSVRDMFFYFFFMAKPVTKEKIGAAFWPDISPAQLKLRFKNNIYRLRHALGQEVILFEDNLYRFNTDLDYECDLDQYESELALARTTQDISQQIDHYQKAFELVHGPFLEDIHADWAWHQRERLDQLYLSFTLTLARLLLQKGSKEEALQVCQRALDRDHCMEEAHQLAMQIYATMRDKAAITRQYRLCQKILHNELGSDPSPETQAVFQLTLSRK